MYDCDNKSYEGRAIAINSKEVSSSILGLFETTKDYIELTVDPRHIEFILNSTNSSYNLIKNGHQEIIEIKSEVKNKLYRFTYKSYVTNCLGEVMQNVLNGKTFWEIDTDKKTFYQKFTPHPEMKYLKIQEVQCRLK